MQSKEKIWVETWKRAAVALDKVKAEELSCMTDEDTRRAIQNIMDGTENIFEALSPRKSSGLVEQQRYFRLFRK